VGAPILVGGILNPGVVPISTTAAKPYQLSNTYDSPNHVFIGTDPSVSDTNYVRELLPGESFTWTEISLPVYAFCRAGETASVVVAFEAVGTGSPGREIVKTKAGSYPDLLAEVIMGNGFASPAQLYNSLTGFAPDSVLDVEQYSSIIFRIVTSSFGIAANAANYFNLDVSQSDSSALADAFQADRQRAQWLTVANFNGKPYEFQIPVSGKYLRAELDSAGAVNPNPGLFKFQIFGSYENVDQPLYTNAPNSYGTPGISTGVQAQLSSSAVGTTTSFVDSKSGRAIAHLYKAATAQASNFASVNYVDTGAVRNLALFETGALSPRADVQSEVYLPYRPVQLVFQNGSAVLAFLTLEMDM